jgi:hypothetical protein
MERECENCHRRLEYFWWEIRQCEVVPTEGEGGGIFLRYLAPFCNPTCFAEYWKKRKEERHEPE